MIMTEKASAPERLPFSCGLKYFTKASLLFYGDAVFVFTIDFYKGTKILILENHDMHFACVQWRKSGFDEVIKKI